jgi:hypothetical protein
LNLKYCWPSAFRLLPTDFCLLFYATLLSPLRGLEGVVMIACPWLTPWAKVFRPLRGLLSAWCLLPSDSGYNQKPQIPQGGTVCVTGLSMEAVRKGQPRQSSALAD